MLALYNNKIYRSNFLDDKSSVRLFTFKETKEFGKNITMFGDTVYEKILNIEDMEELYDVDFYVEYFGEKLSAGTPKENKLHLRSGGTVFAYEHDFEEIERGMMIKTVNIDEASKLIIENMIIKRMKKIKKQHMKL